MEAGYYPMELVLLQETSITLTELDSMDKERKWLYYYYIVEGKQKNMRDMEAQRNGNGGGSGMTGGVSHQIEFPDDFVSILDTRAEKERLEKLAEQKQEGMKEL